ncbi:lipopolysaccharide biosynthesis protein [Pseudoclavibacter sp. RFBG4]|uniref:lipopolysaccharide biosynthesis protein n=1 Tax=Pseudoclavibacter sp. RFBG4 TaxID=2080575 RepID=UPI000CE8DF8D|nr:lipopolysaccharide biosynthesis protein [Pseudoclavibacter sp. RFBG4]PPG35698.1 lipopolysaccharide biosynthesis protein [Pseudoclavibacter sp. RFBG4]
MSGEKGLTAHAARGGAITIAAQLVKIAVMVLSIVVLARLISPSDYGIFAMVIAIVGVAEIFRDFGLSMAALQAKTLSQQQQSNLFWLNLAIGVTLTILVFGSSWLIAAFYGVPEIVAIAQVLCLSFALNGASTQFKVVINRRLEFFKLSLIDVAPYAVGFLFAAWLAWSGWGVWALVWQQVIVAITTLLFATILARWIPSMPKRTSMDGLVGFGWRIAVTQIIGYFTRNIDSIAIGRAWGSTQLGFYDRAYQVVMMPINQINAPLSRVAVPTISRVRSEPERFAGALRQAQLVTLYGTASVFGLLAASGDIVVRIVLGETWVAAGPLVQVLAIGAVFRALSQMCYWIYIAKGLASEQLKFYLIAQPALAAVILIGLPWGAAGVAISYAAGLIVYWLVSLVWACRKAETSPRLLLVDAARALLVFTLPAALACFAVTRLVPVENDLGRLMLGIAAALVWWAVSALLFKTIRSDLRKLIGFVRSALQRRK